MQVIYWDCQFHGVDRIQIVLNIRFGVKTRLFRGELANIDQSELNVGVDYIGRSCRINQRK